MGITFPFSTGWPRSACFWRAQEVGHASGRDKSPKSALLQWIMTKKDRPSSKPKKAVLRIWDIRYVVYKTPDQARAKLLIRAKTVERVQSICEVVAQARIWPSRSA